MPRASVPAALLALIFPLVALGADDGAKIAVKKPTSPPELKVESKKSEVSAVSRDRLKQTLRDALKQIKSTEETAAKSRSDLDLLTPAKMAMALPKDLQVHTVAAIGRTQAKLQDLAGARSTWQNALDSTGEISSFNGVIERAAIYVEIARAQLEAGERSEALFTVRQALQTARAIKAESLFPFELPSGMDFGNDPLAKKTAFFRQIAQIQSDAGEKPASQETFRVAVESADSLKSPFSKVRALLDIAEVIAPEAAPAVWSKALAFARALSAEYPRAKAVEMVIRARLKTLSLDETLGLIADQFKGDLQHYLLWIAADEIANSDKPIPAKAIDHLYQLAQKANFDRPSKKIKVFERIAEAQARLGDFDGAYRTAGEPHPVNDIQTFRATQARAHVMKAIAAAQLKAKQRDAARDTVLSAIEMFAPLPEEDAEAYFPLAELCLLQAQAGDLAGALHTVEAVSSSTQKVAILAEIALGHAAAGRADDARKVLGKAFDASRRASGDALWTVSVQGLDPTVVQGLDPLCDVMQNLANTQAKIGDLDGALKTLAEIDAARLGGHNRNQAIIQIVGTRLEAGDLAGARRVAELHPDDANQFVTEKSSLLERIARQQADKGDPAGLLEWAEEQKAPASRLYILRGLANGIADRAVREDTKAADPAAKPRAPG